MGKKHKSKRRSEGRKKKKTSTKKPPSIMEQVKIAINADEWEQAEKLLIKEIDREPTEYKHYLLGYVYRRSSTSENNKLEKALINQRQALVLCDDKSRTGWVYYEIGKIYDDYKFENRNKEKALENFHAAVACEDTPYDAYLKISHLIDFDAIDERITILKLGFKRFPKNLECYLVCALLLSNRKGDHDEAETVLLKAIDNGIESDALYNSLGEIKIKQGKHDEAISYYKKILTLEDHDNLHARINFIIGSIHIKNEDYSDAEDYLLKALKQNSDDNFKNAINMGLILCSHVSDQPERMIEYFRNLDFGTNEFEDYSFCGRGYMALGVEEFFLDYGPAHHDYQDIIIKAVDSLEEIQDRFDKDLNYNFLLLKAIILENDQQYKKCLPYLEAALKISDSGMLWDIYQFVFEHMFYDEEGEYIKGQPLINYANLFKKTIKNFPVLTPILGKTRLNELVEELFEANKYKKIKEICDLYTHDDLDDILFEAAYSYNEIEDHETAKVLYESYMEKHGETSAVCNNLANLYKNDGRIDEAINLYNKAIELDPENEQAPANLQIALNKKDELKQQEIRAQKEQEKQLRIQQAAKAHWPSLDYFKKKVLMVLNNIDGFSDIDELADLCGMEVYYVKGHYRKLVERGMVIEDGNRFEINPEIKPLIERENSHAVAISIIRSDESINFKPIFNSKLEYKIYLHMISLFPNHLVFPNMSLQSIFSYDRMKGILDQDVFKYYLLTSVDICIVSTANYLPIVCYEVDSPYHDEPEQMARDEKKNKIFKTGGIPLIRLRPHGQPSDIEIKEKIAESTRQLGRSLDPTEKRNELFFQLLKNLT